MGTSPSAGGSPRPGGRPAAQLRPALPCLSFLEARPGAESDEEFSVLDVSFRRGGSGHFSSDGARLIIVICECGLGRRQAVQLLGPALHAVPAFAALGQVDRQVPAREVTNTVSQVF